MVVTYISNLEKGEVPEEGAPVIGGVPAVLGVLPVLRIVTSPSQIELLSVPSAQKQIFFVSKFRSSEPAEGRMYTRTSPLAGSKL